MIKLSHFTDWKMLSPVLAFRKHLEKSRCQNVTASHPVWSFNFLSALVLDSTGGITDKICSNCLLVWPLSTSSLVFSTHSDYPQWLLFRTLMWSLKLQKEVMSLWWLISPPWVLQAPWQALLPTILDIAHLPSGDWLRLQVNLLSLLWVSSSSCFLSHPS